MDAEHIHHIGLAINKLVARLERAKAELRAVESRAGRGYQLRKAIRLRDEIDSLTARIERAEKLQGGSQT
jgi:hypothetical protein